MGGFTSNQPVDDAHELIVDSTDADDADFNMWRNAIVLPRWNANEEFIEYDVQEQEIIGYDLAQKAGNMDDGFVFTNKVWGHTTMPSAGGSDSERQLILFSVSVLLLITGCIVVLRRTGKKID